MLTRAKILIVDDDSATRRTLEAAGYETLGGNEFTLLKCADIAIYYAKQTGNCFQFYSLLKN